MESSSKNNRENDSSIRTTNFTMFTPVKMKKRAINLDPDSESKKVASRAKNEPIKISSRKQIIYEHFSA